MVDVIEPIVSTSPLVRRYSLDELHALPASADGGRYELIAGVLYMVPPPGGRHHLTVSRLVRVLGRFADVHPDRCTLFVPRAALWRSPDTYLEPDLFLLRTDRLRALDAGRLTTADLVVEVLSPGSAAYDRTTKADTYAALGVDELWLVDPDGQVIEQRILRGTGYLRQSHGPTDRLASTAFPGLEVTIADVLSDLE